jgi:N-acetyl-anhydromuramyl-L-alanine amidase AmpD
MTGIVEVDMHLPYGDSYHGQQTLVNRPEIIIVHAMAEFIRDTDDKVYHAVDWLDELKLSAHLLVAPDGVEYRCREDNEVAWHAMGHNYDTLGIEFLVSGIHRRHSFHQAIRNDYVTELQYNTGVHAVKNWTSIHSIRDIKRHSDIDSSRKQDPGIGFPWEQFLSDVRGEQHAS